MQKTNNTLAAVLWIIVAVVGRLIPHPPNMTPTTSMGLFGGSQLSKRMAFGVTFAALIISDLILSRISGYPAFGSWTLFTYTGFAAIVWAGTKLQSNQGAGRTLAFLLGSSLGFWIWTNFGTWLLQGMYPKTAGGLAACYMAALPFLQNALLGDLAWGFALFASFAAARRWGQRMGLSVESA